MDLEYVKEDIVLDKLMSNLYPTTFRYKADVNWAKTLPNLLLTAALLPFGIGYIGYTYNKVPTWYTPKFKEAYINFKDKIKDEPEVKKALEDIQETLQSYKSTVNGDKEVDGYKQKCKISANELRAQLKSLFKTVKPLIKKFDKEATELQREIDRETKQTAKEEKKANRIAPKLTLAESVDNQEIKRSVKELSGKVAAIRERTNLDRRVVKKKETTYPESAITTGAQTGMTL
jgi:uncharacterized membrane-anchored protein YhcB (DUF1043 family)